MRPVARLIVALAAAAALAAPAAAQRVNGQLLDKASGRPVPGASIMLFVKEKNGAPVGAPAVASATTDDEGEFTVQATEPGMYYLSVRKIGLVPAQTHEFWLGPLTEYTPTIRWETVGITLDTVKITTRGLPLNDWTREFYERRRLTHGIFLTRDDMKGRAATVATDWLIGVRGIRLMPMGGRTLIAARGGAGNCAVDVWLDNVHLIDPDINQLLRAQDVAAMEVYPGALDAPARYGAQGCGVLLVWSRGTRDHATNPDTP